MADAAQHEESQPGPPTAVGSFPTDLAEGIRRATELAETNPDEAVALLRAELAAHPDNHGPRIVLAMILAGTGAYREAEAEVRTALDQHPLEDGVAAGYEHFLGDVLRRQDRYAEAVDAHRRAIRLTTDREERLELYRNIIMSVSEAPLGRAEDLRDALTLLDEALQEFPTDAGLVDLRGDILLLNGRLDEAIADYRKAIELSPQPAAGFHRDLANALRQNRQFDEAIVELKRADRIEPASVLNELTWGQVLRERGNKAESDTRFVKALELTERDPPASSDAYRAIASSLIDRKAVEAESAARLGLERFPGDVALQRTLADALREQSRFDEAADLYESVLGSTEAKDADREYAAYLLGVTRFLQRRFADAQTALDKALEFDPRYPAYHSLASNIAFVEGRFDDAIASLRRAIEFTDGTKMRELTEFRVRIADIMRLQRRFDAAYEALDGAQKADPQNANIYFARGTVLNDEQRIHELVDDYQRAVELDPDFAYAHHNLADAYWRQGRYEAGRNRWRAARTAYAKSEKAKKDEGDYDFFVAWGSLVHEVFGDFAEAQRLYGIARSFIPNEPARLMAEALLALEQRDNSCGTDRAEAAARAWKAYTCAWRLIRDDPIWRADPQILRQLAELQIALRELDPARTTLNTATALDPDAPRLLAAWGTLHAAAGEPLKAAEVLERVKSRLPWDLGVRTSLAEAYLASKQPAAAERELKQIIALTEEHIEAWITLGEVYAALAEEDNHDLYEDAIEAYSKAIALANSGAGKRLQQNKLAAAYYARGFARTKVGESSPPGRADGYLAAARGDFKLSRALDSDKGSAQRAIDKLNRRLNRFAEHAGDRLAPGLVTVLAIFLFLSAQIVYLFGSAPAKDSWWIISALRGAKLSEASYVLLTFGSLVLVITGLYLPRILKLRLGSIELEKSGVEQVSTPTALGIGKGPSVSSPTKR
jgi:tetratricopeptide (TPR) repeat protein